MTSSPQSNAAIARDEATASGAAFDGFIADLGIGVFQTSLDGRIIRVNDSCARLFGYDTAVQMCAAIHDVGHQAYVDPARRIQQIARLLIEKRISGFIAQMRRRDGSTFWASETLRLIADPDSGERCMLGSITDISAVIGQREALAAAERDYRSIFENATVGIYRSAPDGRQLRANPALCRLNGYGGEAEMLAGVRDIGSGWYVEPGRRDVFKALMERDDRVVNFESEIHRYKTRERIWVRENAWAVRGEDGRILFYEGIVEDITAEREVAHKLRAAAEQEQRFVTAITHEFRTPLTIIDGAAQRLLRQVDDPRPEDMRTRIGKIRTAVRNMESLIDTMLDSARLAAGRLAMDRTRHDLVAFVEAQIRRFDPAITGREIVLESALASAPVSADARMLEHIVANLLSNAIKYSGAGRRVEVSITGDAGCVTLRVRDHGVGIPADELPQLFTRFFRASTAKGIPGTGIGLNLVHDLVQRHDGRIEVESAPGAGSCFAVTLPLDRNPAPGDAAPG